MMPSPPDWKSVPAGPPPCARLTRREFIGAAVLAGGTLSGRAAAPAPAGRNLDFQIGPDFGNAPAANIEAVLRSAAAALWQHCPHTRWDVPGFYIYHTPTAPICNYEHRPDGRIAIGLTTQGTYWAQFAFQFAHEFCHALAGHSNDWRRNWLKGRKANQWLEEALCETASLFALRAMGRSWPVTPPYPNWKEYAAALTHYAQERLDQSARDLPAQKDFGAWFRMNEAALRKTGTLREKNNVVASRLLPLFEARPAGWEAVTFLNLGPYAPDQPLAARLADWRAGAPADQRGFMGELAAVFDVKLS